jgi:hypothetical protein
VNAAVQTEAEKHCAQFIQDANAHLMAAAPELLEENIRLREVLEILVEHGNIFAREALEGTKQ